MEERDTSGDDSHDEEEKKESKGKMVQRHKRELKDLQAQQQKQVNAVKGDKKKKAELSDKFKAAERELLLKHQEELKVFQSEKVPDEVQQLQSVPSNPPKASKAMRRKAAKQAQEEELEKQKDEERKNVINLRQVEVDKILKKLEPLNLTLKEIPSDGNCLYNAIAHQLNLHKISLQTARELRQKTSSYLRSHPDEFIPYLESDENFEDYCSKIENSNEWGGQLEVKALSHVLDTSIRIISSDAPDVVMGENNQNAITITFHRHYYALGEHYNSVAPTPSDT
eukprot:TRINITY_DN365_c0_g1_i1.p1 TRINITY_DN365_c0_g1~~TRINITY_DN365_c0_g1_i1.p1  ORF type:complete len:282 (-),score=76.48 TRINITY_DN365_c0_g1_i1:97-942(-)